MYRLYLFIAFLIFFASCATQPPAPSVDWLEQIPVEEGWTYFAVAIPEQESPENADLKALFIERLLGYLGLEVSSDQGEALEEIQLICDEAAQAMENEEGSGQIILKDQGLFSYQGENVLAALFAIENSLLNEYQQRLLPYYTIDDQALLNYQLQASAMEEQEQWGSAFLSYLSAARIAAEMETEKSVFIFQQNLRAALALLPSLEIKEPYIEGSLYTGENMPEEAFLSINLLSNLGDTIPFEVYYPHPMNPDNQALARIRSAQNGVLQYSLPASLWEGSYQISIKLDLPAILGEKGMDFLNQSEDARNALNTLQWSVPYQVILDPSRMKLGILIRDRDVLGNPVPQGNTGSKVADLLEKEGQNLYILSESGLSDIDVSLGTLRDLSMKLPQDTELLLIARTSIIDYQAVDDRTILSALLEYRLWDLRTWSLLEQGQMEKQLESTQADQALNNLYTQLSRSLVQEYQRF